MFINIAFHPSPPCDMTVQTNIRFVCMDDSRTQTRAVFPPYEIGRRGWSKASSFTFLRFFHYTRVKLQLSSYKELMRANRQTLSCSTLHWCPPLFYNSELNALLQGWRRCVWGRGEEKNVSNCEISKPWQRKGYCLSSYSVIFQDIFLDIIPTGSEGCDALDNMLKWWGYDI